MSSLEENEIFVSIALATYNGELYLREQLDSLLNQTYKNIEIVVSDDGSTDGTQALLQEYAKQDKRIRWSINKGEHGFVGNFSEAISLCRGEIIFLCDQDDVWYERKIEKHLEKYKDPAVQWVYNEVVVTDQDRNTLGYLTDSMPDYWTRKKLLYYTWGSCVLGCATSYRANLIKKVLPPDVNASGHDSWLQLAIYPAKSAYINEILQEYRQHKKNTVGLKTVSENEFANLEKLAISSNIKYLKSLVINNRLQIWKRIYFAVVLILKIIRSFLKK